MQQLLPQMNNNREGLLSHPLVNMWVETDWGDLVSVIYYLTLFGLLVLMVCANGFVFLLITKPFGEFCFNVLLKRVNSLSVF